MFRDVCRSGNKTMQFSIVIAVRNEEKIIERCLNGVFSQEYGKAGKDYEVIVIDGMSTDGTYEILKNLQKK